MGELCIQAFLLLILLFFQCSGDKAVESWYDEIKDHQFGKEPNSMGTGTNQILFKGVLTFTMHIKIKITMNYQAFIFLSNNLGHFTQVVWKNSKNLGIAKARSSSGKIIVVANYEPAGNFIGQYVQNVPPPK